MEFDRDWDDFSEGFGHVSGDYWLGSDNVHALTTSGPYVLRVELTVNTNKDALEFAFLTLGDQESNYTLAMRDLIMQGGSGMLEMHGFSADHNYRNHCRRCRHQLLGRDDRR